MSDNAAPSAARIVLAEAIGTAILMLAGPGTAIVGINTLGGGPLAVALGFGFGLLVAAYAIGHVSGCHINPAVTFGLWLVKKIDAATLGVYVVGQVVGATIGALLLWLIASGRDDGFDASPANFAANLWDSGNGFAGFWPMVLAEVILTGVLVFVVLSTGRAGYSAPVAGLHAGVTLAMIHMISIPVDNTSVNPARSLGTAIFAAGDAIEQLWAFIVFPLIGAGFGALLWVLLEGEAPGDAPEGLAGDADPAAAT